MVLKIFPIFFVCLFGGHPNKAGFTLGLRGTPGVAVCKASALLLTVSPAPAAISFLATHERAARHSHSSEFPVTSMAA